MNRMVFAVIFAIGLMTVAWVGVGFVGSSWLALLMTVVIAGVYGLGAFELKQFRDATASLSAALTSIPQPLTDLGPWLERVHPTLRQSVRLRVEGERLALPGPALTPYLVGLLVMLGMLGTFLGMVVTFKGVVFALEGSADLQAIRAALAAPIKGLGLSFGTSVAGVAASAMLGLMSAISRRERVGVARQLEACVATVLRPMSYAHRREQTDLALQAQARALPHMVQSLQAVVEGMERRSQQLNEQLLGQQAQFHREVSVVYGDLARNVGQSLNDSLSASARVAIDGLQPVVEAAMAGIAQESARTHQGLIDTTQAQLQGLSARLESSARTVSEGWATALDTHARTSEQLSRDLNQALNAFSQTFEQRSATLLSTVGEAASRAQATQMATLEKAAGEITERAAHQAGRTLDEMAALLSRSEELIRTRIASEEQWLSQQADRMDQLATVWRSELGALRDDEAARAQAAVDRLGDLQAALASHLATLGSALEAPMTRLLQTSAEVPQAAAEVIVQLRQDMGRITERDNLALQERTAVMGQIQSLLRAIEQTTGDQRNAIAALADSAKAVMDQASRQFEQTLGTQAIKADEVAAHVAGSAIELSSLGQSFSHGIELFNASNEKLMDSLQRIEAAIGQSMARSDEQLAYYVAQAREVIDLSITSQQGIVDDLRRLHGQQAAQSARVA